MAPRCKQLQTSQHCLIHGYVSSHHSLHPIGVSCTGDYILRSKSQIHFFGGLESLTAASISAIKCESHFQTNLLTCHVTFLLEVWRTECSEYPPTCCYGKLLMLWFSMVQMELFIKNHLNALATAGFLKTGPCEDWPASRKRNFPPTETRLRLTGRWALRNNLSLSLWHNVGFVKEISLIITRQMN